MTLALRGKLRLDVVLNNAARGVVAHADRLILDKRVGESSAHVTMKFLSWCLWYAPDLRIEASVGQRYKPDLVRTAPHGDPIEWIDCGKTTLRKLDHISTHNADCVFRIVKPTLGEVRSYVAMADGRLRHPERVSFYAFDDYVVERLAEFLQTRHTLDVTVTGDAEHVYLLVDGKPLETAIADWRLGGTAR